MGEAERGEELEHVHGDWRGPAEQERPRLEAELLAHAAEDLGVRQVAFAAQFVGDLLAGLLLAHALDPRLDRAGDRRAAPLVGVALEAPFQRHLEAR